MAIQNKNYSIWDILRQGSVDPLDPTGQLKQQDPAAMLRQILAQMSGAQAPYKSQPSGLLDMVWNKQYGKQVPTSLPGKQTDEEGNPLGELPAPIARVDTRPGIFQNKAALGTALPILIAGLVGGKRAGGSAADTIMGLQQQKKQNELASSKVLSDMLDQAMRREEVSAGREQQAGQFEQTLGQRKTEFEQEMKLREASLLAQMSKGGPKTVKEDADGNFVIIDTGTGEVVKTGVKAPVKAPDESGLPKKVADFKLVYGRDPNERELSRLSGTAEPAVTDYQMNRTLTEEELDSAAQMAANYEMPPSQIPGFGGAQRIKIATRAKKINPQWDYGRAEALFAFGRSPALIQRIKYIENVQNTIGKAKQASEALKKSDIKAFNKAKIWSLEQTGDPRASAIIAVNTILAEEIGNIFQGGTGSVTSDAKLKLAMETLQSDWSDKQLDAALDAINELMKVRKDTLAAGTWIERGGGSAGGQGSTNQGSATKLERGPDGKLREVKQ